MQPSTKQVEQQTKKWVYTYLTVLDGQRILKPTHVAFDRLRFNEPPRLESKQVQIIITNADEEQRHTAVVLPHDPGVTRIPIQIVGEARVRTGISAAE